MAARRTRLILALAGIFVIALAALAVGAVLTGGDPDLESSDPEEASDRVAEDPATAHDLPAFDGGTGSTGGAAVGPKPSGPDTPVSSHDSPEPQRTFVGDPPDAFGGILTFEDCAAAGYPVMESYPEQCRTPDGRLFVRVIDP